jgi:hypothetical protein
MEGNAMDPEPEHDTRERAGEAGDQTRTLGDRDSWSEDVKAAEAAEARGGLRAADPQRAAALEQEGESNGVQEQDDH